jgi:hypothetical protein
MSELEPGLQEPSSVFLSVARGTHPKAFLSFGGRLLLPRRLYVIRPELVSDFWRQEIFVGISSILIFSSFFVWLESRFSAL